MSPDEESLRAAAAVMDLPEDELLLDLGTRLAGPSGARGEESEGEARDRAEGFLARHRQDFRRVICENENLDVIQDSVSDVAVVADLVASIVGWAPSFTVASILIRRGIDRLCA